MTLIVFATVAATAKSRWPKGALKAEEWRAVPGYGSLYEVSSRGSVRRWWRTTRYWSSRLVEPDVILPHIARRRTTTTNYLAINVPARAGDGFGPRYVHELVLLAFVGPRPSSCHQAAHQNGDGQDNRLENLRWATRKENEADKIAHGRTIRGERHPLAKLRQDDVRAIRQALSCGERQRDVARRFNVAQQTVSDIAIGRRWRHLEEVSA